MFTFGSGTIWASQTIDAEGNAVATPQPIMLGTVQEVSVEISGETKTLYGQNQFPVDVARGPGSISGTIKTASFSAKAFNSVYFGTSITASGKRAVAATAGTAIQATVTITPAAGTFAGDLGVVSVETGEPFARVASTPAAGQYSVDEASGVYTFNSADAGKGNAYISYLYTTGASVKNPETIKVMNLAMGHAPKFKLVLQQSRDGKNAVLTLPACVADSLKLTYTNDDFSVPEISFSACADASGQVFEWSFT